MSSVIRKSFWAAYHCFPDSDLGLSTVHVCVSWPDQNCGSHGQILLPFWLRTTSDLMANFIWKRCLESLPFFLRLPLARPLAPCYCLLPPSIKLLALADTADCKSVHCIFPSNDATWHYCKLACLVQNYMLTQSYMLTSVVWKSWQQRCCAGCKGPTDRLNHSHAGYTSFGYIRQHWNPGLGRGISGRPCLHCMSQYRFPPASVVEGMKSIPSVCLWQLFSTLTGEPLDLLT